MRMIVPLPPACLWNKTFYCRRYQNQGILFPADLNEMVVANHPVRTINDILDQIDITQLIQQYKPGGASSYHPRMLL